MGPGSTCQSLPPFLLFFLLAHPGFALAQLLVREALACGTAARAVRRCSGRHGFGTRRLGGFAPLRRVLLGIPSLVPAQSGVEVLHPSSGYKLVTFENISPIASPPWASLVISSELTLIRWRMRASSRASSSSYSSCS